MGTAAETWMERGRIEGMVAGILEGKAETFLRKARLKLSILPDTCVAQVNAAGRDQLDWWLNVLILIKELVDVFTRPTRHCPTPCKIREDKTKVMKIIADPWNTENEGCESENDNHRGSARIFRFNDRKSRTDS